VNGRTHRCRAFILRTADYGESDRVITLIGEDLGKVAAIARGARSSRRRFGGSLEQFALLEVSLARGRGRLPRLAESSLLRAHGGLALSLARIGAAGYVLELVRETLPENQPEPRVFALIEGLLPLIAEADEQAAAALAFAAALHVLALAGLRMSVSQCNACGTPVPAGRKVYFDPRRGGVVCTPCGGGQIVVSALAVDVLIGFERDSFEEIAGRPPAQESLLVEIEHLLAVFFEQQLERPLKSSSFLQQINSAFKVKE
jgi:DNA repair protein RecO (recombination protein O)